MTIRERLFLAFVLALLCVLGLYMLAFGDWAALKRLTRL